MVFLFPWQDYNLDLNGLTFTSFSRVTGYSSLLSASDTSYAITALLEYETVDSNHNHADVGENQQPVSNKAVSSEAFNNAYEALGTHAEPMNGLLNGLTNEGYDSSNLVNGGNLSANIGLGAGLRRAMALQKTIINTAAGLMERGAIALLRHFRYAHVTSSTIGGDLNRADLIQLSRNNTGNDKGDHIFSKPLALTRLAHFLMTVNRENDKWTGSKARPLILIADKPSTGKCLVVGYEYTEQVGSLQNNRFGKHFERTASAIEGLSYKFDSFESNVIELNAGDVQRFMESLHVLLDDVARTN
jgi:cell division control protein 45